MREWSGMQRAKVKAGAPAHPNTRLILRFNLVGSRAPKADALSSLRDPISQDERPLAVQCA
jgi:hypothetical protein